MIYEELVAAAKAYADRNDLEVEANMDVFILMAEARINRILKTREQSMRITTPVNPTEEYYALPEDYSGMRDIHFTSMGGNTNENMQYLAPSMFNIKRSTVYSGTRYYTIVASQLQIFPVSQTGGTMEMIYYQNVPNLSEDNPQNWVSNFHPDIYLSGIISEIEAFVKNYDVSKAWDQRMTRALDELEKSDEIEVWSGTSLTVRTV